MYAIFDHRLFADIAVGHDGQNSWAYIKQLNQYFMR